MKEVYIVRENMEFLNVPLLNIVMMTDEHWNRLAYQNWMERRCGA